MGEQKIALMPGKTNQMSSKKEKEERSVSFPLFPMQ